MEHVAETMRPLSIERLANAPPFVLGLTVVRGSPVPVVHLARMLGSADAAAVTRFVTIRCRERTAALAVDAVLGVAPLPRSAFAELPPIMRDAAGDVVDAIGTLDADLLFVLKSAEIVPESVWAQLDAQERSP